MMATRGADIVVIHGVVWNIREAIRLLDGLPQGEDYNATLDSLEEALNAAEGWAMDPKWNEESAARQQAWMAADPDRIDGQENPLAGRVGNHGERVTPQDRGPARGQHIDGDDTELRAIFGEPVEGRDFTRIDGLDAPDG